MAEGWPGLRIKDGKTVFSCPVKNCFYHVQVDDDGTGSEHTCPWTGKTTLGWSAVLSTIEQIWEELDSRYATLMQSEDRKSPDHDKLKGEMRGLSVALAHIISPYHADANSIARETAARYELRLTGVEPVAHTGQGIVLANKPADADTWRPAQGGGYTSQPEYRADQPAPALAAGDGGGPDARFEQELAKRKLTEKEQGTIKKMVSLDMMPVHELCQMYGVSEGLVEYLGRR